MKKTIMLTIMDGFGITDNTKGNAVKLAGTPNLDELERKYANTTINASGLEVGLPDGQMGNSEVGHTNIGAGRIVYQELTRITKSIKDGDFYENEALCNAMKNAKNSALHLMGLLSDGGVHSHIKHLKALIDMASKNHVKNVYIHAFMDGRDTDPKSGLTYIKDLEDAISEIGVGKIATVSGRYYAMDRDNRWERVEKAYNALVLAKGNEDVSATDVLEKSYENNLTDEFVVPTVIMENNKPVGQIQKGDSIVFFNFRPDRARELTRAIVDEDFSGFEREYKETTYITMTTYDITIKNVEVAFKAQKITNTFGELLAKKGLTQLRAAETEKYAHVTFFFNGGVEKPNKNEDRVLINSPKVATYDLQPEMSAYELEDAISKKIDEDKYDVIIVNFANPDMVGHTGDIEATKIAVKTVDKLVGKLVKKIVAIGGCGIVTADHGNAELMLDPETGKVVTSHSTNPVPFIVYGDAFEGIKLLDDGKLADIVPTMLDMINLEKPEEMTGKSLIKK